MNSLAFLLTAAVAAPEDRCWGAGHFAIQGERVTSSKVGCNLTYKDPAGVTAAELVCLGQRVGRTAVQLSSQPKSLP